MQIVDLFTGERLRGQDLAARLKQRRTRLVANFGQSFRDHPFDESCNRRLSELIDYLRAVGPEMEAFGEVERRELRLFGEGSYATVRMVKVRVDWPDYAPLKEGKPNLHFRVEVQVDGKMIGETRAGTLAEAEEAIRQSFGL